MGPHAKGRRSSPIDAVTAMREEEANKFLLEHGVIDVDLDIQPVDEVDAMRSFLQHGFEATMVCAGILVAVAGAHGGRAIFHA